MRGAILLAILLAGCGQQESPDGPVTNSDVPSQAGPWDLETSDEGAALTVAEQGDEAAMRLFCPAGEDKLVVNVSAFRPIGSEERLSFGQGGEVVALVADPSGDALRGGVTAEGSIPPNLVALLSGGVSARYGAQVSGPHPVPPAELVNAFAAACSEEASAEGGGAAAARPPSPAPATLAGGSACLTGRDGRALPANRIRTVGTEPFWGAQVEGRCVTYSTPENIDGTRVWTEFSGSAGNGTWSGFLNDRPFVMRTRPQQGCSDGMSDKRYPIAVKLTVNGEERTGCAEPR